MPIIAVTAHGDTHEKTRCFEVGMTGFMSKPATPRDVKDILTRYTLWTEGGDEAASPQG